MNKEWSEMNKQMQVLIGKKATYKDGTELLIKLRNELFEQITQIVNEYPAEAFYQMPYANAKGYHSKTLSYSIWHIFRIEDIVAHILIAGDEQILMAGGYQKKIGSPVITTGNELQGQEIAEFSKKLNVRALYEYAKEVMLSTNSLLTSMEYSQMKTKYSDEDKKRLIDSGCVSPDENARWLIDYWCGKDIIGLIKMPFSRHWIMHVEAMLRIKNKL
ncbi:MAG: phage head-tail adapter protein [Clostridiaceae bacterium]|nr:phage head-tail adapter protein [Clostridiaceae bacterium]HPD01316.1 phage head-tail adapter protein [Acetivibrio sp.]